MSTHDLFEDGFPHGTRQGYQQGCRGSGCPAGIEHGLSCRRAFELSAGDYRYSRLVAAGHTPAQIAEQLHEAPHQHPTPTKPRPVVPDDEDDTDIDPELEVDEKEEIMPTPKTIAKATAKKPPTPAPASGRTKQELAEIRAWAAANGIACAPFGRVPRIVLDAYDARDTTPTPEPVIIPEEVAERIEAHIDEELAALNAVADTEPYLPERTEIPAEYSESFDPPQFAHAREQEIVATYDPDLVAQLEQLNTHLENARQDRDAATNSLRFVLTKWAEADTRADAAEVDLAAARASARILQDALAQAEDDLTASRELAAHRAREVVRLEEQLEGARPWWKRGAA